MAYDFNPNIPYYYQIKEDILQRIEGGVFSVGDQLTSEMQLAEEYGVSRPTVRQAIAELVQEGILTRGRGKGTFISQPFISDNSQIFSTFLQSSEEMTVGTKILEVKRIYASGKIAQDLNIEIGDEVHEIVILRTNNEEKLAVRVMQIPVRLVTNLNGEDLNNENIYHFLQNEHGVVPTAAVQSFQCVVAAEEESSFLEIEIGDPLMLWQGIVYSEKNIPIIRVKTLFRGDRFKFYITQGNIELKLNKDEFNPIGMGTLDSF